MHALEVYQRSVEHWQWTVQRVPDEAFGLPTPCSDWDVRALIAHVVGEDCWTAPLLEGRTIAEVGDPLDADLLERSPRGAALRAALAARHAFAEPAAGSVTVHLSYGDDSAEEYAWQLAADHLVHSWDLAVASDQDPHLPPGLVDAVGQWYAGRAGAYRSAGLVADPVEPPPNATPQALLLGAFGRDPGWSPALAVAERFGAAFGRGVVDEVMALMTDDCVFESTEPAPDGRRLEGAEAVRKEWTALFDGTRGAEWTPEESFAAADRAVVRWRFAWREVDGSPGHVRGVDVLRVRDGKVAEKLSYVKG